MKKLIFTFSIFALLIVFNNNAKAQEATAEIDASANVITQLDIVDSQAVNFGNIQPDLNPQPTLNPVDGSQSGVQGEDISFGYVVFSGTSGQTVSVDFEGTNSGQAGQETLTATGTDNEDEITYNIQVAQIVGDKSSGSASGTNLQSGNTVTLGDSEDNHTLWVGGTLSADDTPLSAGSYEGSVEFTIDYSFTQ